MTKIFVTMTALVLAAGSAMAELPQSVNGPASSGLVQLATGNPAGCRPSSAEKWWTRRSSRRSLARP